MCTYKDILTSDPKSKLAHNFFNAHQMERIDGEIFIDRNAKIFEMLVDYLRNERKIFPEFDDQITERNFFMELNFWDIDKEKTHIQKRI
jgi:hypothetical protein